MPGLLPQVDPDGLLEFDDAQHLAHHGRMRARYRAHSFAKLRIDARKWFMEKLRLKRYGAPRIQRATGAALPGPTGQSDPDLTPELISAAYQRRMRGEPRCPQGRP